jgi:hypothetical protein
LELVVLRRHGARARPRISHARVIAAKLALLGIAVGAEWLIGVWTTSAGIVVAVGIVIAVALFGPVLQRRGRPRPVTGPATAGPTAEVRAG